MHFVVIKDYHHALMDGPWFVGDQYLHVQAWEADFHPQIAKITTTAVWIRLEQLPIEYYHPEFLKHVGNKLGKLLKIDAITNAAIRGRYARVCVQMNTIDPLPKRVRIGSFWQDIVYENLPVFCFHCGRIGHRETHCTEGMKPPHTDLQAPTPQNPIGPLHEPNHVATGRQSKRVAPVHVVALWRCHNAVEMLCLNRYLRNNHVDRQQLS